MIPRIKVLKAIVLDMEALGQQHTPKYIKYANELTTLLNEENRIRNNVMYNVITKEIIQL